MKQYAFWEYDIPPFLLGGVVEKVDEEGYVTIENRYQGYRFRPVAVVPLKEGLKMQKKLDKAERKYRKRMEKAKNDILDTVHRMVGKEGK